MQNKNIYIAKARAVKMQKIHFSKEMALRDRSSDELPLTTKHQRLITECIETFVADCGALWEKFGIEHVYKGRGGAK